MTSDANLVLSVIGANSSLLNDATLNVNTKTPAARGFSQIVHELKHLPRKLVDALLGEYALDMYVFGYKFDLETMEASCVIRTADGGFCC